MQESFTILLRRTECAPYVHGQTISAFTMFQSEAPTYPITQNSSRSAWLEVTWMKNIQSQITPIKGDVMLG